jgi:hypothetical protein
MSERIRELALEAGLYYHPHGTCCMDEMFPFHFNPAEADKAYGKFAELIVLECINTLEFHGFEDAIPYVKWMATNKLGVEE